MAGYICRFAIHQRRFLDKVHHPCSLDTLAIPISVFIPYKTDVPSLCIFLSWHERLPAGFANTFSFCHAHCDCLVVVFGIKIVIAVEGCHPVSWGLRCLKDRFTTVESGVPIVNDLAVHRCSQTQEHNVFVQHSEHSSVGTR